MGHVQKKVYAVLCLYDSFTRDTVQMKDCQIKGALPGSLILKDNGCYVFMETAGIGQSEIEIISDIYEVKKVRLSELTERGSYRQQVLWMKPSRNYIYPSGAEIIKGTISFTDKGNKKAACPKSYQMVMTKEKNPVRLLADCAAGTNKIRLKSAVKEQFEESFGIFYRNGEAVSPMFKIKTMDAEADSYLTEVDFEADYKKGEVVFHRVIEAVWQDHDMFGMALPEKTDETVRFDLFEDQKFKRSYRVENGMFKG